MIFLELLIILACLAIIYLFLFTKFVDKVIQKIFRLDKDPDAILESAEQIKLQAQRVTADLEKEKQNTDDKLKKIRKVSKKETINATKNSN